MTTTIRLLLLTGIVLLLARQGRAQLSGSIGLEVQTTRNVQSLDTLTPDRILLPSFELDYAWQPASTSSVLFSGSFNPALYSINSDLSYSYVALGAVGLIYVSNTAAIKAESAVMDAWILPDKGAGDRGANGERGDGAHAPTASVGTAAPVTQADANEAFVEVAEDALYSLSEALDTTEISRKGNTKAKAEAFEALRDSISELVSGYGDRFDSLGYDHGVVAATIRSLKELTGPLQEVITHAAFTPARVAMLNDAISALEQTSPPKSSDPAASTSSTSSSPTQAGTGSTPVNTQVASQMQTTAPQGRESLVATPTLTLLATSTRLRDFGASEVSVEEDLATLNATTLADRITIPFFYSAQTGRTISGTTLAGNGSSVSSGSDANPNDNNVLSLGASFEGFSGTSFSYRLSYDFSHSEYPHDTVYSNTEHRVRVMPRIGLSHAVTLFGEFSLGARSYTDPLDIVSPKGKSPSSNFTQYTYGAGFATLLGSRAQAGLLAAFSTNTNLRAYVVDAAKGKLKRNAVQIADDEYTYDLSRYAIFVTARLFWDIDGGFDLSREHRLYGSLAKKANGKPAQTSGSGRTDDGTYATIALSRDFTFDERLFGAFTSASLESQLRFANVTSTSTAFSYKDTGVSLGGSLGF